MPVYKKKILSLVTAVRDSFSGSEIVYTHGSCYKFHLILKSVFPTAVPYTNGEHIISKIWTNFFDINGQVHDLKKYYHLSQATEYERNNVESFKWAFRFIKEK